MRHYFAHLPWSRQILWCYLLWYLLTVTRHFDGNVSLWLNALGISAIIGSGLLLSIRQPGVTPPFWVRARLYLMPFCVSSFSALIKDRGFVLIFAPDTGEVTLNVGVCVAFVLAVRLLRRFTP